MTDVGCEGGLEQPRVTPEIARECLSGDLIPFEGSKLGKQKQSGLWTFCSVNVITYAVEDYGRVTGKVGNEIPVRLLHSSSVGVFGCVSCAETPLQSSDNEDREKESESPCEHRSRKAREGDCGRGVDAVLCKIVRVDIAGGDVPERCGDGTSENNKKEGQSERERAIREREGTISAYQHRGPGRLNPNLPEDVRG